MVTSNLRIPAVTSRGRCYALAGALSVETAELLRELHRVVGAPGEVGEVPPRRRALMAAAARTYGAAAACSALTARLLLAERDSAAARLGEPVAPQLAEFGVTTLGGNGALADWRTTVRAAAAALGELMAAKSSWQATDDDLGDKVTVTLDALMGYVDDVATALEKLEPAGPVA